MLNTGLLRKLPGPHIAVRADVENSGSIDISDTLIFEQSLTNHPNGNIRGNGFLDVSAANFVNNGTLAPGNSPGILSVIGNYPLSDAADVAIELGGKTPGSEHDQLRISGAAHLTGSRLQLSLLNGFCSRQRRYAGNFANSRPERRSAHSAASIQHIMMCSICRMRCDW
ncbi:MAG: hypothetical protein R3C26_05480 [Calditrichia bacterium]